MSSDIQWVTKQVKVSDLKEWPRNPRKITKDKLAKLVESVNKFGSVEPPVINTDYVLCGGHGRKKAYEELGIEVVDCVMPSRALSEKEFEELNIRLNKNIAGEWDFDILANEFEVSDLLDWGFEATELVGIPETEIIPLADEDEVPEVKDAIAKRGDVWILGNHRVMCGDSTMIDDVEKLRSSNELELMYTDPPYGVKLDQSWRDKALGDKALGKGNKNTIIADDRYDWSESYSLFHGDVAYVWCPSKFYHEFHKGLDSCDLLPTQMIIWNKSIMVMGRSDYHWKHEPCIYAIRKNKNHRWSGDRKQVTVWDAASPNHIMGGSKDDKTEHPSQKPISLAEIAINNHDCKNIYDPFLGSGTTLIACEKTNRKCYGMELDEHYCDVIINRWQNYTGKEAILESSGQKYNELIK